MKGFIILLLGTLTILIACDKDKFETKPTLELKSVNREVVPMGQSLILKIQVTDKEGDVDNELYIWKVRLNQNIRPLLRDTIPPRKIPEFPDEQSVELELTLDYQNYLVTAQDPPRNPITDRLEPDTLDFKFLLKDKGGNESDTLFLRNIVVERD